MAVHFHWADILVLVLFLLLSFAIGLYHAFTGDKQRTTGEFIMANRQLRVLPTMMSLTMSSLSAILILGGSAEMYNYGVVQLIWWIPGLGLGILFVQGVIVPWLYPVKLVSVYDYLELRYKSRCTRLLGSTLGILNGILYIGVATYAPSIALEAVTGFSMFISIPLMSVLATVYTSLGGMRAVIWTDVFQGLVLICGMLAVLIKGLITCGGLGEVLRISEEGGRLNPLEHVMPEPRERNSLGNVVLGTSFTMVFMQGLQQASVQRYSAVTSLKKARWTMLGNFALGASLKLMTCCIGLSIFSYFALMRCDPLANNDVKSANQILPLFVMQSFKENKGFTGLFMATLYSGALSSISSSLSGTAANIWEDILKKKYDSKLSEYQAAVLNKCLVTLCGVLGTGVAFVSAMLPGPVTQVCLTFFGACGGPLVGMYLMGGLFRRANWIGAFIGGLTGFATLAWIGTGSMFIPPFTKKLPPVAIDGCPNFVNSSSFLNETLEFVTATATRAGAEWTPSIRDFYQISYLLYNPVGVLVCFIVGLSVSFLTRRKIEEPVDDLYLIKWRDVFFFWKSNQSDKVARMSTRIYRPGVDIPRRQKPDGIFTEQQGALLNHENGYVTEPKINLHDV